MSNILKYILPAFLTILLAVCVFTLLKSCMNKKQPVIDTTSTTTDITDDDKTTNEDEELAKMFEDNDETEEGGQDEAGDEGAGETAGNTAEPVETPETTGNSTTDNTTTSSADRTNSSPQSGSSSQDSYLVLAGSFISQQNAKKEVSRLKKLGYDNAELIEFDFSEYHSVCVDRKSSLKQARVLKNSLRTKHSVEAYIHKKRRGKRK